MMSVKLRLVLKQPTLSIVFICALVVGCNSGKNETEISAASVRAAPITRDPPISTQPIVIADAHSHHGLSYQQDKLELSGFGYFERRGIKMVGLPMPIKREKTNELVAVIRAEIEDLRVLSRQSRKFQVFDSLAELESNAPQEMVTIFLSVEYFGGVFGGKPETVDEYREMGISSITLIDNDIDRFFSGARLTLFGKQVIRRMNGVGILVDIAHLSEEQSIEVIRFSESPVIASHSAARSVSRNDVGLSDGVLDALKDNVGYVFTTFNKNDLYLKEEFAADGIDRFIEHVVYLTEKLGVNHVGIGTDYQALGKYIPGELNEFDAFQMIQNKLREHGFSDEQLRSFSYGAFLGAMGSTSI